MTYNEKLAILVRYRWLEDEIKDKQALASRWRSRAEQMTAHYGAAGPSSSSAGFPAALENAMELEQEIEKEIAEAKELYLCISRGIKELKDPRQAAVLRQRFLLGYSPERIAWRMHYDVSYVHRLKKDGIKNLKLSTFVHSDRDKL